MKENNVKVLVRLTEVSYDDELIRKAGIEVKVSVCDDYLLPTHKSLEVMY